MDENKAYLPALQPMRNDAAPYPLEAELASTIDWLVNKQVQLLKARGQRMLDWANRIEDWGLEKSAALETHELQNDDMIADIHRAKALLDVLGKLKAQRLGAVNSLDRAYTPFRELTVNLHVTSPEEQVFNLHARDLGLDEQVTGKFLRNMGRGKLYALEMPLSVAVAMRAQLVKVQPGPLDKAGRAVFVSLVDKLDKVI